MDYLYSIELPFTNTKLKYKELSSLQQLNLCKLNILYPLNNENSNFIDYSSFFKDIILKAIKNKKKFNNINIIEYILFVTKLRITSIGKDLNLLLETDSEQQIKVTIDLNSFIKKLYDVSKECLKDNIINIKNLKITIDWPNIEAEHIFSPSNEEPITSSILKYIKNISIENSDVIDFYKFNDTEQRNLYEKFPLSVKNYVQEKVLNMITSLSDSNLFELDIMKNFSFNFYNTSYQRFIRYLFSGNIRNIYQEYYILASKNINPSYVNSMSISERTVYCSFIEEEVNARSEASPKTSNSTDLEKLMAEFGEQ
jgi:hypothetical protein